ncbi:hypothetical protein THAOC_04388 [Thalassiosira oceanica]|uniref:RXYLT1 C-terminal domain-containing protein n=1 Tax=Thalassiosira oceanica TaxID=159749 RepID=K0T8S3_THAOC|nr:hypothetical protein THAOC_04388 [Thalassiosira oceanica]|eukprot:EJK73965.1 hypothetical protein THAOC_04388 [Thalassiosira oceanica]
MARVIFFAAATATALALLGPLIFMLKSETYLADNERAPTAQIRRRRLGVASLLSRRLGLDDYLDPKTEESKGDDYALMKSVVLPLGTTKVTIYRYQWTNANDDSSSFLDTEVLKRFGSGRASFNIVKNYTSIRGVHPSHFKGSSRLCNCLGAVEEALNAPCVAIQQHSHSSEVMDAPLIQASSRHYVYNALFATSSHYNRGVLAKVIAENRESSGMRSFVHVPDRWGNETKSMLTQEDYVQVLLRSVFTLAPTGHNPECFRLHEAVEAGSIPIFATGDYYAVIPCKGSIDPWLESPMITLRNWDELYSTMQSLLQDPRELDRRQNEMRVWYVSYMRATVWDFENFVLSGYHDPYT